MSYKVEEFAGEIEEEVEVSPPSKPPEVVETAAPEKENEPNDYSSLSDKDIAEKIFSSQQEPIEALLGKTDSLMACQNQLFDELDKLKSSLYDKEYLRYKESIHLIPEYIKKLRGLKVRMKRISETVAEAKRRKASPDKR
eukprot:TRINITY_DN10517_c0_g1_i1.p1 TRINITY_DN10517_c0_g1~~TRINITY_DN10517_c0_g1_i1.p1  ORF type:complete len:140 (-),score=32.72 TRINITY_DN10517_c0_g1_i1:108-527(-)